MTMQLPFTIVKSGAEVKRFTAFIFGYAGAGKTYLVRSAVGTDIGPVLLCSCDEGHLTVQDLIGKGLSVTQTPTIEKLEPVVDFLLTPKNPFRTVVVDNLTELHRKTLLNRAEANSLNKARNYYSLTQQDYGEARNQMLNMLSTLALEATNCNVIFTALAVSSQDESSGLAIEPALGGKVAYEAPSYADLVGYLSIEKQDAAMIRRLRTEGKEVPKPRRVLQCEPSYTIKAVRNRGGRLPELMPNPSLFEIHKLMTKTA